MQDKLPSNAKLLPLNVEKTEFAIVDADMYDYLSQFTWRIQSDKQNGRYAGRIRNAGKVDGKYRYERIFLHRLVNATPDGFETDHINRNTLDNRRANLRTVTRQENIWNRGMHRTNKTGFLGVSKKKNSNAWIAQIGHRLEGRRVNVTLGSFDTPEEAAAAYQEAMALRNSGEPPKMIRRQRRTSGRHPEP